jgi:hypothetical protein
VAVVEAQSASDAKPAGLIARLRGLFGGVLTGTSEASLTKRLAGTVFLIRVLSAGLAYFSQVLLARWMGGSDYGIYVYVWTWVLLLGSVLDFGIAVSAQKIIPEYRASGELDAARLPLRQPLDDIRGLEPSGAVARGYRDNPLAVDRRAHHCAALYRLPHPARFRCSQHAGRSCALP